MKHLLFPSLILLPLFLTGQPIVAEFDVQSSSCLMESVSLSNTSLNASTYNWDFCTGDFEISPNISLNISGPLTSNGFKIVEDQGVFHGFSIFKNKLYRLDFGEVLENIPVVENLGDLGVLTNAEDIDIVKDGEQWIGFVGFGASANGGTIFRLTWDDLTQMPLVDDLGNFGVTNRIRAIEIVKEKDVNILVLAFYNGQLCRVDFGATFGSTPLSSDVFISNVLTNVQFPVGLSVIKHDGEWKVALGSIISKTISVFNLGGDLLSEPVHVKSQSFDSYAFLAKLKLVRDGTNVFAVVSTLNSASHIINLKSLSASDTFEEVPIADMPVIYGVDIKKKESRHYVLGVNSKLQRLIFENTCSVSQDYSIEENPIISYSSPGSYAIDLVATDTQGNTDYITKSITVTSDIAPPITFTTQNVCQSAPIQFTSESSSGGLTYTWDFGDTNTSTDPNPSHTYATAGDYEVTLEVQDGTCSNFVKQNITIYEEPVPDFNIPGGNICTNQPYSFINTTTDNFDGLLSYEWQLDGMSIATTRDLDFEFTSGGTKELKLITTIPGCSVEVAKNLLNIKEGTLPQFSFDDNCMGQTVQFTNNSVGSITDIAWDFGNGFTSTLENPALEFATDGTYDVTLTLTNADGCVTNATTPITIHPLPSVNFSNELACENLGTQFSDLSSVTLDNLAAWEWQFDDGTPISNEQNPQHEFGNFGDFNVKLVTTTTFGCKDSTEQVVNVLQAPIADFSLDKVCIDVPIQFTDESTPVEGEDITNWSWSLGGTFSSEKNPTLVLTNALDYDFSLTVTSQNLCTSTISKTTTIPPKPTVSFDIENDCANEIATFLDVTDITGDNITQREWLLENESLGNGITLDHQFAGANDYNVTLEIETENGCSYSSVKPITVNPVPVAAFSTSFTFGAPPFIVDFTNNSQGATAYNWTFEENEFSTELNPIHTFNDQGSFDVQLIAVNEFSCTDSTVQRIEVLDPLLDLQLLNFSIVPSQESDMLSISVKNHGTIRLDSLEVVINLGGKLDVYEVIRSTINPEETITAQLELKVNNRKLDYICIGVNSYLTDIEEVNKEDNNKCVTFNANPFIFAPPFPNPTKDRINLEVISTLDTEISIEIISSKGTQSAIWKAPINEGSNQLSLDVSNLQGGLYYLKLSIDGQLKSYPFVVNN